MELLADRFSLVRSLGHGGIAQVFLAKDTLLGRDIAIKMIHAHLASDPLICERFKRELAVARSIPHPGILELFEFFEDGSQRFITMEYMPGADLKNRLVLRGALSVADACGIMVDVLPALAYAHGRGVVHRDIKPHNILFDSKGRAKLGDFGLARLGSGEGYAVASVFAGTPEYCPPEVVLGQLADARSDIYSLGIVLFEMLAGRLPFSGNSPLEILRQQVQAPIPDLAGLGIAVPDRLAAALLKAVAKDPSERFRTAAEFADAIAVRHADASYSENLIAPERSDVALCPTCGKALSESLPYCFACGVAAHALEAAPKGTKPVSVVVMGPGKPGFKLDDEYRQDLLSLIANDEADSRKLVKSIPRLPFKLAGGMEASSAASLARELGSRGIEASLRGAGDLDADRAIRVGFWKKILAVVPRMWLILFGASSGFWIQIGRNIVKSPELILAAVLIIFVAMPLGYAVKLSLPLVKLRKKTAVNDLAQKLKVSLRRLQGKLSATAFQGMAHDVGRKVDAVVKSESAIGMSRQDQDGLVRDLDAWVSLCLCAQDLERYLKSRPEAVVRRDIRAYENKAAAGSFEARDMISKLMDELAHHRAIERTLDQAFDRLLGFGSLLDSVLMGLSAGNLSELRLALGEFTGSLADADDLLSASRETHLLQEPKRD